MDGTYSFFWTSWISICVHQLSYYFPPQVLILIVMTMFGICGLMCHFVYGLLSNHSDQQIKALKQSHTEFLLEVHKNMDDRDYEPKEEDQDPDDNLECQDGYVSEQEEENASEKTPSSIVDRNPENDEDISKTPDRKCSHCGKWCHSTH